MGLFGTGLYGTGLYGLQIAMLPGAGFPFAPLNPQVINPLNGLNLILKWDIQPTNSPDKLTFFFDVYRGRTTDIRDAVKVNTEPILMNQFVDTIPQSLREPWYYFVVSVGARGATASIAAEASQYTFTVRDSDDTMRFVIAEIIRRHNIILDRDGENFIYYIRKWSGPRCSCYDPIRQDTGDSNCPNCFGTTFDGGYFAVRAVGRFVAASEVLTRKELGLEINNDPSGWGTLYPLVTSQDLIRRQNNIIYRITSLSPQIQKGILTRQSWNMHELERGLIEYTLPVMPREVVAWVPYAGVTVTPVFPSNPPPAPPTIQQFPGSGQAPTAPPPVPLQVGQAAVPAQC